MSVALLTPRITSTAIEERYAAQQCRLLIRRSLPGDVEMREYDPDATARSVLSSVTSERVVVVTDPLIAIPQRLGERLLTTLDHAEGSIAVPAANDSPEPGQKIVPPRLYLTLRQFEQAAEELGGETVTMRWTGGDPALFAARRDAIADLDVPFGRILSGRDVTIDRSLMIHRFATQRGQLRSDLLARVPLTAVDVLEFGCGEAALGAALKRRQPCRVTGIELDPSAATVARSVIDHVLSGDVRTIVREISSTFDTIIGGDIVEHLDDPWGFLTDLRRVAKPDATLLLSLPNIANWAVIADLLRGRFDYVYLGILCAGHLRFFTRRSLEELLMISGWEIAAIEPQGELVTEEFQALTRKLISAGIEYSTDELVPLGWYVTAVNRR